MSGIHRRNPDKFYPETEKQVRTEIHGQNGELIFLDKHPIEIVKSVNNYAALKASYRELLILAKDLHYEKFQRSGHMEKGCDCEVWAAIARAQEVTK